MNLVSHCKSRILELRKNCCESINTGKSKEDMGAAHDLVKIIFKESYTSKSNIILTKADDLFKPCSPMGIAVSPIQQVIVMT